jgi:hypothetical protein
MEEDDDDDILFSLELVDRSAITDGTNKSKRYDSWLAFLLDGFIHRTEGDR